MNSQFLALALAPAIALGVWGGVWLATRKYRPFKRDEAVIKAWLSWTGIAQTAWSASMLPFELLDLPPLDVRPFAGLAVRVMVASQLSGAVAVISAAATVLVVDVVRRSGRARAR